MAKLGRPRSVMTPEAEEKIIRTVRLGIWPDRAADMHGISKVAMRQHRRNNPEFFTALEKAEAEAEASIHGKILRHMDKQWTACAWMLERRWPKRWAKREYLEASPGAKALLADLDAIRRANAGAGRDGSA
jgi:transposase